MRIAYLTHLYPPIVNTSGMLTPQTTEAMAKKGHQILIIATSDRQYTYHIYRDNITIVQLRSLKCRLFIGQQPLFLPFLTIFQSLFRFRPNIIYLDTANLINWVGYLYSFFSHIPTRLAVQ